MTIPMPKKEYITFKIAPEHSRRYQQLIEYPDQISTRRPQLHGRLLPSLR